MKTTTVARQFFVLTLALWVPAGLLYLSTLLAAPPPPGVTVYHELSMVDLIVIGVPAFFTLITVLFTVAAGIEHIGDRILPRPGKTCETEKSNNSVEDIGAERAETSR